MKRFLVLVALMLTHLSLCLLEDAPAAELNVPADFSTIQAAINAANTANGDTVLVEPGTYSGPVTLRSSVPIRGRETARTFITGGVASDGTIKAIIADTITGVTVENFTISNTTVGIDATSSDLSITNNVFTLGLNGSTIAIRIQGAGTVPRIINNTFYQNNLDIQTSITDITIKNNIFFGSATHMNPNTLVVASITYNAFSDANPSGPDLTSTTNLLSTDPLFVDPTTNDFHLKHGSPCIDAGDSSITDFIDTTRSDIGAYGGNTNLDSIPMKVSGPSATGTSDSITVTWDTNNCYLITDDNKNSATNPHGYRLYYGSSSSGNYNGTDAGGNTLPSPVKIDLHNNAGVFPPYTLAGLSPPVSTAPAAPILLGTLPANQSLELSWTPVSGATGYKVHYGITSPTENEIPVGNTASFTLQGLTNGQVYHVAVSAFVQTTYFLAITAFDNASADVTGLKAGETHESALSAEVSVALGTPQESGLSNVLSDFPEAIIAYPNLPRKGCFIATAAYGGANAPAVRILRNFRDRYLVTNAPGRAFVRWYYEHSPAAARIITDHPWLKPVARTALAPAVGAAMFMTETNGTQKFLVLVVLFCIAGWILQGKKLGLPGGRG